MSKFFDDMKIGKLRYTTNLQLLDYLHKGNKICTYDCRWYEGQAKKEKKKQAKGRSIGTLFHFSDD